MAYVASWHRDEGYFWPRFGGPKEPWWIGHSFCISLPAYVWYKISFVFMVGLHRAGVFKLHECETINDNWRHIWRQVIGRE